MSKNIDGLMRLVKPGMPPSNWWRLDEIRAYATAMRAETAPAHEWIERWHGSGPDLGWAIWEREHGNRIAYVGEGEHSERLASLIVAAHNAALASPPAQPPDTVQCPDCKGYGRVNDGSGARSPYGPKCPKCGGSGRLRASPPAQPAAPQQPESVHQTCAVQGCASKTALHEAARRLLKEVWISKDRSQFRDDIELVSRAAMQASDSATSTHGSDEKEIPNG